MLSQRRTVDWSAMVHPVRPVPRLASTSGAGEASSLLSAFNTLMNASGLDAAARHAVELARSHIGFTRCGVFLLDETGRYMLGTWGSDLQGNLVDEHHVMFEFSAAADDVFRRSEVEGQHFTVLDGCPIVVQRETSTQVAGRSWVACTPIRSARARVGMMFNDTGLTAAPVDEGKQARAAMLCSLLGNLIEVFRVERPQNPTPHLLASVRQPTVQKTLEMLTKNPALSGKEIAVALRTSNSRVVRLFKSELGISLVQYRNQLRLERFRALVGMGEENLLRAARGAGFGSYAQFYRVFRGTYGSAPRDHARVRAALAALVP